MDKKSDKIFQTQYYQCDFNLHCGIFQPDGIYGT